MTASAEESDETTRTVGILLFPGFQILDVSGPAAVFETASVFARSRVAGGETGGAAYRLHLLSAAGGAIASSCGISVASRPLAEAGCLDTLLVPGGPATRAAALDPRVSAFLVRCGADCRRLASVCTGAFLLARAGLLDGRRATTHWRHAARLARAYPAVQVQADRIWVRDGPVWTSAGVSAGIDLALALVTDDLGRAVARRTAREVVVYYQRPGGQSQFSTIEELGDERGRFTPLLAWIRANLHRPLRVEDLAEQVAMSPRNFSRRFRAEVGCPPARAVVRIRLEEARRLVETTGRSIQAIARDTGFGDAETMRRAFVRLLGQPPRAWRTALGPAQAEGAQR